jgi:hypothetical protein
MCLRHPPEVNNSRGPHETHLIADQYDIPHLEEKEKGGKTESYILIK